MNNFTDFVTANAIGIAVGDNIFWGLDDNFGYDTVIHELGHVLDYNNNNTDNPLVQILFGGGPSDDMVKDVGGSPDTCIVTSFCGDIRGSQWYVDNVAGPDPWPIFTNANRSVADDFADTFLFTITGQYRANGRSRVNWMSVFMTNLSQGLP